MTAENSNEDHAETNTKAESETKEVGDQLRRFNMAEILISVCGFFVLFGGLWLGYLGVSGSLKNNRLLALWIFYGTVIFGLTSAFIYVHQGLRKAAIRTANEAQRSPESSLEKSLRDSNRAWVSIDLQVSGPITFDARGAVVRFLLILTNTGRSPALKVSILPKVINRQNPNIIGEQREICGVLPDGNNLPGSNQISWGITVFPGPDHAYSQAYALTITPEELARSKDFEGYFKGRIMPHILGCIDYAIDSSGERHQTFFSYSIMTVNGIGERGYVEMGRTVHHTNVFVYRDGVGWGAN